MNVADLTFERQALLFVKKVTTTLECIQSVKKYKECWILFDHTWNKQKYAKKKNNKTYPLQLQNRVPGNTALK